MARRKKRDGGADAGAWLNTYADMVTLLLTFFILLFSMSTLDAARFNMLVTAFAADTESSERIVIYGDGEDETEQADSEGPDMELEDLEDVFDYLKQLIEENELDDLVEVTEGEGYVFIRFMDDMLFEPNSARLKPEDLEILNFVGLAIKSIQDDVEMISVNGHTAAIPERPDYEVSDRRLSSDRANAVLMYFEDDIGIISEKMFQVGWGKFKPVAGNEDEESRSQNRRVEIIISSENPIAQQLDNIYEKLADN